jgi:hypothetical protein
MGVDPKACVWLQAATSCRWRTVSPSTFKEIFSGVFSTIGDKTNSFPQLCYTPPALHPGGERRRRRRRRRGNSIPMKTDSQPKLSSSDSPTTTTTTTTKEDEKKLDQLLFPLQNAITSTSKDSSKAHHHPHEL